MPLEDWRPKRSDEGSTAFRVLLIFDTLAIIYILATGLFGLAGALQAKAESERDLAHAITRLADQQEQIYGTNPSPDRNQPASGHD